MTDGGMFEEEVVHIDCHTCELRNLACSDCVVTVLLGAPPAMLDEEDQRALGVLADSGLVPPLRLVNPEIPTDTAGPHVSRRRAG
jgi:hypothetical protein